MNVVNFLKSKNIDIELINVVREKQFFVNIKLIKAMSDYVSCQ